MSVIAVSLYPSLFMYFNNLGNIRFIETAGVSGIIVLIAVVLLVGNLVFLRDFSKAAVAANLLMFALLYFALIERAITKIFPMLHYWHVVLIGLFIFTHVVYLVHKKMSSPTATKITHGLLAIFAGLILFNGLVKIPSSIKSAAHERQELGHIQPDQVSIGTGSESEILPNVYYFIFDEYAGYDGCLRYCDYDNSDFYHSLEELGFVTSKHSINETSDTFTEIPNLLQLKVINTVDMSANEKKENFKNPYLVILMKKYGYLINYLDVSYYHLLDETYADYRFTSDFISTFRTFNSYIISNTALYPFYGANDQDNEINLLNKMFAYGEESSKLENSYLFTVGYFDFPHLPYIVDENGNKTNASDRSNLRDPVPYCKQLIYANKKILEMVRGIIMNDPISIIILQSDHGFRLPSHLSYWYGINDYDLEVESPFERNILNAVYYPGKVVDIEGLSGLNTLKVVLNELLGTDLEIQK
jgi:hypothetical protein